MPILMYRIIAPLHYEHQSLCHFLGTKVPYKKQDSAKVKIVPQIILIILFTYYFLRSIHLEEIVVIASCQLYDLNNHCL